MIKNMWIVDTSIPPREAFVRGFLKGLGAPVMLIGYFESPPLPRVPMIDIPHQSINESLQQSWLAIGNDIRATLGKHEQEVSR